MTLFCDRVLLNFISIVLVILVRHALVNRVPRAAARAARPTGHLAARAGGGGGVAAQAGAGCFVKQIHASLVAPAAARPTAASGVRRP
jgi:hypothetical protein